MSKPGRTAQCREEKLPRTLYTSIPLLTFTKEEVAGQEGSVMWAGTELIIGSVSKLSVEDFSCDMIEKVMGDGNEGSVSCTQSS